MGVCSFCGHKAGFLRSVHKECQAKHEQATKQIIAIVQNIAAFNGRISELQEAIALIAKDGYINGSKLKSLIVSGWERAVDAAFDDGVLTEEEEAKLSELKTLFSLSQDELDQKGSFSKVVKGGILREVMSGTAPEVMDVDRHVPFNLQKTEKLIWLFQDVDYYEDKTRTHYVGGSQGVSIRIARGVYYRVGGFKGKRVQTLETALVDTGLLGITNKHLYFCGSLKKFRIAYRKVVTFEPFSDGIGLQRDAQTAKPQTFVTGDGWFTYNLITNLAQQ